MKKIVGLAAVALLATTAPAAAGIHIGFGGGYAMPLDANQGRGPALNAYLALDLTPNLALEIGALGYQTAVTATGTGLMAGTLDVLPIELSLKLHFPVSSALGLFVAAGGGAYIPLFTQDATAVQAWEAVGFTPSEKLDVTYGFHVRGGLELALGRNLGLVLETRYAMAKANGTWTLTDEMGGPAVSGKITGFNLDTVVIGLGLNIAL